jgi:membrane protein implicated in regulation of membrane protease activity
MSDVLTFAFVVLLIAAALFSVADGLATAIGAALEPMSRWMLKQFFGVDRPRAGADSLVGKRVLAQEDFARARESGPLEGYVVVDGERWRARAADGTEHLASGDVLNVSGREGLVLLVSPVDGE